MAHSKARRNEKNLIRADAEYNYTKDFFKGVDFSAPDGRCDDEHFAYLVNLYRDKEKADGAALESVPGYRMIAKSFMYAGEIYGIYSHDFVVDGTRENYLLVHKGAYLYSFLHDRRDLSETLSPIASLSANRSCGFAYGGCFYLLDGKRILELKTPFEAVALGKAPDSEAYIPLLFRDGEPYEERNMLTGFFDLERTVEREEVSTESQGLFYRECLYGELHGLEVYGMEEGRRIVAIPESVMFNGKELPILAVAPDAFKGRNIKLAVFAPSVKVIGARAFFGCASLERVLIHGAPEIRSEAFSGCKALKDLALQNPVMAVNETAFDGCGAVTDVYMTPATKEAWLEQFDSTVSFHPYTLFFWKEQGESVYIPCENSKYQSFEAVYGAESEALTGFKCYFGLEIEGQALNEGFTAKATNTAAYVQYYMQSVGGTNSPTRYVFASVCDESGRINTRDDVEAFGISLPDYAERVVSVSLDGKEIGLTRDERGAYYAPEYTSGRMTSVRVLLPRKRKEAVKLTLRCYGVGKANESKNDFYAVNSHYTGNLYDAVKSCRFAAVFDGRVFLGGNPELPDTVFYSVTPKRENTSLMFAPTAYLACLDTAGAVSAFAVHPLYLAIVKDRSLYGVTRASNGDALHELYEINGWCSSPKFRGVTYTFGDEPLFLSERGVMALKPGKAWEEGRIENRSYYVDGLLGRLNDNSVAFTEWKGYLVLLIDGKIFLGDASIAEKKNGTLAYEWYFLDGIGHYNGDAVCYHHLSHDPVVHDKRLTSLTVSGKRLWVLGREEPVLGEVYSTVIDGITVYYTLGEDGEYYLVDSRGEKTGGFFSPATCILSTEGCLYFSTSDGYLFCFNTDMKGKSVLVNNTVQSVTSDELHSSFYTFDGHAYPSCLITGNVDMGVPHLLKRTMPRSLTVRAKSMPHSAFTVSVRCDGGPWEEVGFVVANDALACPDADRFVFSPESTVSEVLADRTRGWLAKQAMVSAEVFETPIGFDALAYRYKMAGRTRSKTK
ncbi:MAG: leucine-rich repeat protein [Clostridia bacterium]|nr:leucine-rich repeat protein [Clostridia bacterium]